MDAAALIDVRSTLKGGLDLPLYIATTGPLRINELEDFVIWDDVNHVIIVFKSNSNYVANYEQPCSIYAIDYGSVDFMYVSVRAEELAVITTSLKDKLLLTVKQISRIFAKFADTKNLTKYLK